MKSDPGPDDDLVGRGQGSQGLLGYPGVGRDDRDPLDVGGIHNRRLALDVARHRDGFQDDGFGGGGDHPTGSPEEAGGLVQAGLDVTGGGHEAGQDEIAQGMTGELVGLGIEPLFEDLGQEIVVGGQSHQTFAEVAGGNDPQLAAETARRSPRRRPPRRWR